VAECASRAGAEVVLTLTAGRKACERIRFSGGARRHQCGVPEAPTSVYVRTRTVPLACDVPERAARSEDS